MVGTRHIFNPTYSKLSNRCGVFNVTSMLLLGSSVLFQKLNFGSSEKWKGCCDCEDVFIDENEFS